ncbi:MAG TPA: hypothetical protein VMA73_23185 [Streptosporangiaceae bacterium]|nr:hypothetical protein [Streptosporangiaceae bacterium]
MAVLPLPRRLGCPAGALVAVLGAAVTLAAGMPASALAAQPRLVSRAAPVHAHRRPGSLAPAGAEQIAGSADATATALAEAGGGGGAVTFTATVTDQAAAGDLPVTAGSVSFYSNGASRPLGTATSGRRSSAGVYTLRVRLGSDRPESIVAVYTPPAGSRRYRSSRSAAVSFTEPGCINCAGVQTVADLPAGMLSISTPYTATDPLNVGTLELNSAATFYSASAPLDPDASDVPTAGTSPPDPTFTGITIVDTQSSNLPWTLTAWASPLSDGGTTAQSLISGENVGITGLTAVPVPGNSLTAADVTFVDQPAADPPVGPTDTGSLGLGGQNAHVIVTDAGQAEGTIGINGTITINAPLSTEPGAFGGTIVLTLSTGTPSS